MYEVPLKNMSKKHHFPFKLGCTSYVYPADIVPNVRLLAPVFDDIELVLFESSDYSNMPDPLVIAELAELSKQYNITYTVHFPIDRKAGSEDPRERFFFTQQAISVIELTEQLGPFGYILHLEGIRFPYEVSEVGPWKQRVDSVCADLARYADPKKFCVETLGYDAMLNIPLVNRHSFSHCIDIGHLWIYKQPWQEICTTLLPQTRVIHFHGLHEGKDHKSLIHHDKEELKLFINTVLRNYSKVVTIELFSQDETFSSVELLKALWEK